MASFSFRFRSRQVTVCIARQGFLRATGPAGEGRRTRPPFILLRVAQLDWHGGQSRHLPRTFSKTGCRDMSTLAKTLTQHISRAEV